MAGHHEEKSGFWLPPIQRQKWADTQVLPHVNWGDLFFDLFYVAGAYNLATVIKTDKSWESVFYFIACFGPLYTYFWNVKTIFDARFGLPNDVVHPIMEVVQLCALATAVSHIRPVEDMSHPADSPETFLFCAACTYGIVHSLLFSAEIRFIWIEGEEEPSKHMAEKDLKHNFITFAMNLAATIYAGILFYTDAGTAGKVYHGPMIIMLAGWMTKPFITYLFYVTLSPPDFKKYMVPLNISFCIHRYGEWTMLMLGESVLSLLIVNDVADSKKYQEKFYATFYVGIVSVTLLQFLYFKSQPHDADRHAMRRTRISGFSYAWIIQLYSAALIIVGVAYKMILTEYTSEYAGSNKGDSDGTDGDSYGSDSGKDYRFLGASSSGSKYTNEYTNERQRRIAWIFGLGLGAAFLFLDWMTIAHNGFEAVLDRCRSPVTGKIQFLGIFTVLLTRIMINAFVLTFSFYYTEPNIVAWFGLIAIILQVCRTQNLFFFHHSSFFHIASQF
jgi:low temperature requirement protein LtrA